MKKLTAFLLVLAAAGSLFAGGRSAQSSAAPAARRAKGQLPLVDGNVTMTAFFGALNQWVTSVEYADNIFTKRITDETGVKFEFVAAQSSEVAQKRNVLLSSGDYPEIFFGDLGTNGVQYYAAQGILAALDQYEPLSYPNIKAAFDEYPALWDVNRGTDGKLYGLPAVNDCFHCHYSHGRTFYYMPWIRDNNRKQPGTLEEFRDYLRWIRDNDVNGNGDRNDEIPLSFEKNYLRYPINYVAKSYMPFVHNGSYFGLSLDDSRKVVEQYRDPRFRQALQYLAGLYAEKLMLPDSFTQTRDQLKSYVEAANPTVGVVIAANPDNIGISNSPRTVQYFYLPPMAGPAGQRYSGYRGPWDGISTGMVITDKCKDPELAVALYDYLLNFDVELDGYIGPKGRAWADPDPGVLSLMGGKSEYKLLVTFGAQAVNGSWNQANPMIRNNKFRLGEQATDADLAQQWIKSGEPGLLERMRGNPSYNEEFLYFSSKELFEPYKIPDKYYIPPIMMSDTDNARYTDINTALTTYLDAAMVEFITGVRNINNDAAWNTYLAELDRLGTKDLVALLQKYIK
jgi:putative aldouronate transport system substrate-binding protein